MILKKFPWAPSWVWVSYDVTENKRWMVTRLHLSVALKVLFWYFGLEMLSLRTTSKKTSGAQLLRASKINEIQWKIAKLERFEIWCSTMVQLFPEYYKISQIAVGLLPENRSKLLKSIRDFFSGQVPITSPTYSEISLVAQKRRVFPKKDCWRSTAVISFWVALHI